METGDILVLFSDGVTEAVNPLDEDFGDDRLGRLVESLRDRPAAVIVEAIDSAVTEFTKGAPAADDITVVVVRRV
jgi:sigma-B regulation protein RsbU (phosphoserine phosphatase)